MICCLKIRINRCFTYKKTLQNQEAHEPKWSTDGNANAQKLNKQKLISTSKLNKWTNYIPSLSCTCTYVQSLSINLKISMAVILIQLDSW